MLIGPAGGATGGAAGTAAGWGRAAVDAGGKGPDFGIGAAGTGARPRMRDACVWLMTAAALAALPCVTALVAPAASATAIAGLIVGDCAGAKQLVYGRTRIFSLPQACCPLSVTSHALTNHRGVAARQQSCWVRALVQFPLGLPTRHVVLAVMARARVDACASGSFANVLQRTAFSQAMPNPLPRHVSCGLTPCPESDAKTAHAASVCPWETAAVIVFATSAGTQGCCTRAVRMPWTAGAEAGMMPVAGQKDALLRQCLLSSRVNHAVQYAEQQPDTTLQCKAHRLEERVIRM